MLFISTKALRTGFVSKIQSLGVSFPSISTVLVKMTEDQGKRSGKLHYSKPSF